MARITAAEAAQIIQQEQRQLNNGRQLPRTLNRIRVLMETESVFICNVGPWEHRPLVGALGELLIPGYDSKADTQKRGYAISAPIPGVFRHAYVATEDNYGYYEDDGHQVALEAIGVGFGMHPMNSLVQYGVFVPEGKEPTHFELQKARKEFSDYCDRLIEEARDAYDKGPAERKAVIGERHLFAARLRGLNEAWVHHQHTQESVQCKSCGTFNPAGIAKCKCGNILDFELHFQIEEEQKRRLAEYEERVTRPAKK